MSVTQAKAQAIAQAAIKSSGNAVVDPTTIITAVIAIIGALTQIYKSCQKTPAQAAQHMKATASGGLLGWLDRRRLWNVVLKQDLPDNVTPDSVYYAVLDSARSITTPDVAALYRGD